MIVLLAPIRIHILLVTVAVGRKEGLTICVLDTLLIVGTC
jgi:hypothetical protein